MKIDGTVTISIQTFEELKAAAEEAERYRKEVAGIVKEVTELVSFDDKEYLKRLAEIDEDGKIKTDKRLKKVMSEALALLKIVVDAEKLKRFLNKYIDDEASENCCDLYHAKKEELERMQIILAVSESDTEEEV